MLFFGQGKEKEACHQLEEPGSVHYPLGPLPGPPGLLLLLGVLLRPGADGEEAVTQSSP